MTLTNNFFSFVDIYFIVSTAILEAHIFQKERQRRPTYAEYSFSLSACKRVLRVG